MLFTTAHHLRSRQLLLEYGERLAQAVIPKLNSEKRAESFVFTYLTLLSRARLGKQPCYSHTSRPFVVLPSDITNAARGSSGSLQSGDYRAGLHSGEGWSQARIRLKCIYPVHRATFLGRRGVDQAVRSIRSALEEHWQGMSTQDTGLAGKCTVVHVSKAISETGMGNSWVAARSSALPDLRIQVL